MINYGYPDQELTSRKIDLTFDSATVATSETSTSITYADLSTSGPAVTLSSGVTQDHEIHLIGQLSNNTLANYCLMSVAIAGATAIDANCLLHQSATAANSARIGNSVRAAAMVTGSVHTAKYRTTANTLSAQERCIIGKAI